MHRKMLRRTCSVAAMEIKPREIAFSVAIVFVMVALGFLLGSKISDHIAETNEKFTTAAQITDDEHFSTRWLPISGMSSLTAIWLPNNPFRLMI